MTPLHGTTSRYQYGCRCDKCRAAIAAYRRVWRRSSEEAAERDREVSRRWKRENRERNRARDREYSRAKQAGERTATTKPESPFERLIRNGNAS